jgi:PAS domain-containing protein
MIDEAFLASVLDSLKDPVLVADAASHEIVYMNRAAISHYEDGVDLLGRSLLDCHNEKSNAVILEVIEAFAAGEEERLISEDEKRRIYMRAVRSTDGDLVGYFERYETIDR